MCRRPSVSSAKNTKKHQKTHPNSLFKHPQTANQKTNSLALTLPKCTAPDDKEMDFKILDKDNI